VGGDIFHSPPDQTWGQAASYTMGTRSFPGVKQPGCDVNHPPFSSTKVKEKVELTSISPAPTHFLVRL